MSTEDPRDNDSNDMADAEDDYVFLTVEQVIVLHAESIRRYSPGESTAIRDPGLLESAVMAPQQTFGGNYLYPSAAEMAAAYLIGLSQNHAFENGNKRIGFAACSVFLRLNGYQLLLTQDEAVALTMGVVNHKREREQVIAVLQNGIQPL